MATIVQYGSIVLYNVRTASWQDDVQYDDSGTDKLFTRHRMRFECLVHQQGTSGPWGGVGVWTGNASGNPLAGDAVNSLAAIRAALESPRKNLTVTMGGVPILQVTPASSGTDMSPDQLADVDNGPKPRSVTFDQITTGNISTVVVRISFEIEACQVHCGPQNEAGNVVLSNRWSITEELDQNAFTTRTIRGKLRLNTPNVSPEIYRALGVPFLENGFKRQSISFSVNPNQLEAE